MCTRMRLCVMRADVVRLCSCLATRSLERAEASRARASTPTPVLSCPIVVLTVDGHAFACAPTTQAKQQLAAAASSSTQLDMHASAYRTRRKRL